MNLQVRRFDAISVYNISRQLVHSLGYFWGHDAPSHRIENVDELCRERVSVMRVDWVGALFLALTFLTEDSLKGDGRPETMRPRICLEGEDDARVFFSHRR